MREKKIKALKEKIMRKIKKMNKMMKILVGQKKMVIKRFPLSVRKKGLSLFRMF
jgi:hypothetical protein